MFFTILIFKAQFDTHETYAVVF